MMGAPTKNLIVRYVDSPPPPSTGRPSRWSKLFKDIEPNRWAYIGKHKSSTVGEILREAKRREIQVKVTTRKVPGEDRTAKVDFYILKATTNGNGMPEAARQNGIF